MKPFFMKPQTEGCIVSYLTKVASILPAFTIYFVLLACISLMWRLLVVYVTNIFEDR